MPLRLECDAPGCGKQTVATHAILGRPEAPDGFRYTIMPGKGRGRIVLACCDAHLPAAAAAVGQERSEPP